MYYHHLRGQDCLIIPVLIDSTELRSMERCIQIQQILSLANLCVDLGAWPVEFLLNILRQDCLHGKHYFRNRTDHLFSRPRELQCRAIQLIRLQV